MILIILVIKMILVMIIIITTIAVIIIIEEIMTKLNSYSSRWRPCHLGVIPVDIIIILLPLL